MGSPVYGGPMARLAMEASRRRLAREQEICEVGPRGRCGGTVDIWEIVKQSLFSPDGGHCVNPGGTYTPRGPTGGVLCAPDAAVPATPDELRRLAREVLRAD